MEGLQNVIILKCIEVIGFGNDLYELYDSLYKSFRIQIKI